MTEPITRAEWKALLDTVNTLAQKENAQSRGLTWKDAAGWAFAALAAISASVSSCAIDKVEDITRTVAAIDRTHSLDIASLRQELAVRSATIAWVDRLRDDIVPGLQKGIQRNTNSLDTLLRIEAGRVSPRERRRLGLPDPVSVDDG